MKLDSCLRQALRKGGYSEQAGANEQRKPTFPESQGLHRASVHLVQIARVIDHYVVHTREFVDRIAFRLLDETMGRERKWSWPVVYRDARVRMRLDEEPAHRHLSVGNGGQYSV